MSANGANGDGAANTHPDEIAASAERGALIAFERQVRAAFLRPPSRELAERHIEAMLAEARLSGERRGAPQHSSPRRAPRRAAGLALRLAALALTAFGLSAGLALAGVRPPEPIADVLEAGGIEVPGQDDPPRPGASEPPAQAGTSEAARGASPVIIEATAKRGSAAGSQRHGRDQRDDARRRSADRERLGLRREAARSPRSARPAPPGEARRNGERTSPAALPPAPEVEANPGRSAPPGRSASAGRRADAHAPRNPGGSAETGSRSQARRSNEATPPRPEHAPDETGAAPGAQPPSGAGRSLERP